MWIEGSPNSERGSALSGGRLGVLAWRARCAAFVVPTVQGLRLHRFIGRFGSILAFIGVVGHRLSRDLMPIHESLKFPLQPSGHRLAIEHRPRLFQNTPLNRLLEGAPIGVRPLFQGDVSASRRPRCVRPVHLSLLARCGAPVLPQGYRAQTLERDNWSTPHPLRRRRAAAVLLDAIDFDRPRLGGGTRLPCEVSSADQPRPVGLWAL